jgi:NADH dehydrogenase [ubiquinone] 1 alpha subcomplex assembly factor 7
MTAEAKIREEINNSGFITVDRFMEIALFDEEFGYYRKKNPIGIESDFITSPEISVLFGEIIGLYIVNQIREKLFEFDTINLVELGAGKGTLMNDILNCINKFSDIYQKVSIKILEINSILVEIQRKTLVKHINKVNWIDSIKSIESPSPCVFIANEFFDALPVKQFVKQNDTINERVITIYNSQLKFAERNAQIPPIIGAFSDDYDNGDIIEYSLVSDGFIKDVCDKIKAAKGSAIIIDYGHANFASGDTLQSVYKHKYNNIFDNIGDADLTTHVNFRMLYNAALNCGLKDLYLQTQSEFLKSMGILTRAEMISKNLNENQKSDLFTRVNRLIDVKEMGDLFKFLIVENF